MNQRFHFQSISYNSILKAEGIKFREDEKCLNVGRMEQNCCFVLFISCRTLDTPAMLKACLPVINAFKTPFRLIKNQNLQYRLNSGSFGDEESGKVVSIFPNDHFDLRELVSRLISLCTGFKGPIIPSAQRVSETIYIQKVDWQVSEAKISMPRIREIPLAIPSMYAKRKKQKAILNQCYLPVQKLRSSAKGNIYKSINLKRLAFTWCLIKQGNPVAFDDHFDRDMKDRLEWQKDIITKLQGKICTPSFLDLFDQDGATYLVLEFAEGESLGHHVRELLSGTDWKTINKSNKEKILSWYLQAVDVVKEIHENGIVHRDITDSNFILLEDGRLCVIDFELSYSIVDQRPDPPFLLGTFGYASPEQLQYHYPDYKDDIYSLGALLAFALSGCQPHEFLNTTLSIVNAKLIRLTGNKCLTDIACRCLRPQRKERPSIAEVKKTIEDYLQTLKIYQNEAYPMVI